MKIGVVEFCTVPLVVTSQLKTSFAPFGHKKWKTLFSCGNSKNPSYESCWPWEVAYLHQNGIMI
jgi:hypothetical protein